MSDIALYRRLLRQARPYWLHLAVLFGIGLLASPIALLNPVPLKLVVDSVLGTRPLPPALRAFLPESLVGSPGALLTAAVTLLLAVAALAQLQALANKFMQAYVGERLVLGFRTELVQQAQRLSLSYHDSKGAADSLYRIQQDAAVIDKIMVEGIIPFITAAITLGTMIVVTARLDWQLALVALAVSPPLFVLSRLYRPRMRRQHRHIKKLESSALAVVQETLGALRVVKAFGGEQRETDRFAQRSREGVAARIRMALTEGRYGLLVGVTTALGTGAVLFIGVRHVQANLLTLGQLLMAVTYLGQLYEPLKTVSKKAATLQSYLASAERAFALLDQQPEVPERPDARPLDRARGALEFRGVSFAYGPDRPVLHDVSCVIPVGTRLGIVGATGAGKTTLISLLTRFYDPQRGAILLDGTDLREYRLTDLRRQFAVVLQEAVLFSTSIAENIAYAAPGATRPQIVAAAQAANAHEFIERLPQGYETQVGERGVKLSGGQRQRVALARAFLKDAPVLILDEPTSSVDAKTEAAIVDALERLKQGRTVIVISHRPTTLAGCSALLTIDGGRVVADTTPAAVEALPTPAPPSRTPTRALSEKRRENLLAHPAVQAWRQLHPDRVVPDRITPAKFKPNKPRPNLTVYRLEGVGVDSAAVIAKRCTQGGGQIERTVYERILPHVPLAGPRYYGTVSGSHEDRAEDVCWLFIGEIQGEKYDMLRPDHRAAAARWLGILHTEAQSAADQAGLPDGGPSRYRDQMRATRDLIRAQVDNPAFSAEDVAFLDVLVARFDELDEDWDRLARACTGLPPTLIHGDFNAKNLRVQASPQGAQIGAFDWEDAGRAVPGIDLAQAVDPSCRISASPDLATYWAVIRERWPNCDQTDIERLATCGAVWRALAVITWDGHHLTRPWADAFLPNLRMYEAELTHALDRFGWPGRAGRASPRPTLQGRAG
jgi:ATP-binding cassette, subfamily B, bacterial